MKLRSRLLLGYWYLVAILILSAAAAAIGFHRLGANIGLVLDENFDSVRASMSMLHALERQDSALLASLLDQEGAEEQIALSDRDFRSALEEARGNVTLHAEGAILNAVAGRYGAFCTARDQLIASSPERPLEAYQTTSFPLFEAVKSKILELLDVNHQAMVAADREARATAQSRAVIHGLLVVLALFSLIALSKALGRELLDRLAELRQVAQALAAGDRGRRVTVVRDDELGLVAQQINQLLDRELEVEGELTARLHAMRHLLLGLLAGCAGKAALLSCTGEVVASALDENDTSTVEKMVLENRQLLSSTDTLSSRASVDGQSVELRRLSTTAGRVVGWLVTLDDATDPSAAG